VCVVCECVGVCAFVFVIVCACVSVCVCVPFDRFTCQTGACSLLLAPWPGFRYWGWRVRRARGAGHRLSQAACMQETNWSERDARQGGWVKQVVV